jgi:hypothetical protein
MSSVSRAESSTPVKTIDDVRTRQLRANEVSQSSSIRLTDVVKDALERHYGSLKCAALSMKPPMDLGQLSRELKTGDFKLEKLERLDDEAKAFIADALHEASGHADPRTRIARLIREGRRVLDELAEVVA